VYHDLISTMIGRNEFRVEGGVQEGVLGGTIRGRLRIEEGDGAVIERIPMSIMRTANLFGMNVGGVSRGRMSVVELASVGAGMETGGVLRGEGRGVEYRVGAVVEYVETEGGRALLLLLLRVLFVGGGGTSKGVDGDSVDSAT
jgi:hypothetical protein